MYSPKIKPEKVRLLYQLKLLTGKAMTKLVDEAVGDFITKQKEIREKGVSYGPKNSR